MLRLLSRQVINQLFLDICVWVGKEKRSCGSGIIVNYATAWHDNYVVNYWKTSKESMSRYHLSLGNYARNSRLLPNALLKEIIIFDGSSGIRTQKC